MTEEQEIAATTFLNALVGDPKVKTSEGGSIEMSLSNHVNTKFDGGSQVRFFIDASPEIKMPKLDGQTFVVDYNPVSCGVATLIGVAAERPEVIVKRVMERRLRDDYKQKFQAFTVFSDVYRPNNVYGGCALAQYIRDNNLGEIWESPVRVNPNSNNHIAVWVWMVPRRIIGNLSNGYPVYQTRISLESRFEADERFKREADKKKTET